MATKGFTKVDNCILLDADLSLEAKGLYSILKHLSTIPGFKIARDYVKKISGYGETAFRRVWKELKEAGLVLENKLRDKGRYVYTYTLKTSESTSKAKVLEEKKHVDSDGNIPIEGQVSVDDVLEEPAVSEYIKTVVEATGFTTSEASELLKETNDVSEILESYAYVKKQKNIKNLFNYTRWGIVNKIKVQNSKPVSTFNNFKHRQYDFKKLERALLYGEPYELPA